MRCLPALLATLVPLALSAQSFTIQPTAKTRTEEVRTLSLAAGGTLTVTSDVGRVKVVGWDRNDVELRAVFKPGSNGRQATLEVDSAQGRLSLKTRQPKREGWFSGNSASCDLEVRVPAAVAATLRTDVGAIQVEGIKGPLDLRSDVGSIEGCNLDGQGKGIKATTDVGKIRLNLKGVKGNLVARTDVGSISVDGSTVRLTRKERSRVEAEINGGGQAIELRTDVGSIKVE